MKFGKHLRDNIAPEYGPGPYLDYRHLDDMIRVLSKKPAVSADQYERLQSLTTNGSLSEESFRSQIDKEMAKVESFTLSQITELRKKISEAESNLQSLDLSNHANMKGIQSQMDEIEEGYLRLEKYVNLNIVGFNKILKKHDRHLPDNACKAFYVTRMHSQAWVRGDYSDVVVCLSALYSTLRRDQEAKEDVDPGQSILRQTKKYWIKTEHVSRVKYATLRHLPVLLQTHKTADAESDSQLVSNVYLDNDQLELYHGRLDTTPRAIVIRLRWYGIGDPKIVSVDRKTRGDMSTHGMKDTFTIKEEEVQQIMTDTLPIEEVKRKMMEESGASQAEADEWGNLAREITRVIASKQLVPTMYTQYMRTEFQNPSDATLSVSLDTNICMISERGFDLQNGKVWHRDSSKPLAPNEITRFPHAVLEIKSKLNGHNTVPPKWLVDLQNSGLLHEVDKYSKFVHGCATLLPENVRAVPYWMDDASVRSSIVASGGGRILARPPIDILEGEKNATAGAEEVLEEGAGNSACGWLFSLPKKLQRDKPQHYVSQ